MNSILVEGQLTRQPPGSACLHCRNKKLKCDAHQPRCRNCFASGSECIRSTVPSRKRGPRKDHVKVSQSQKAENTIGEFCDVQSILNSDCVHIDPHLDLLNNFGSDIFDNITSEILSMPPPLDLPPLIPNENVETSQAHARTDALGLSSPYLDDKVTELMHADLDQLYMDRIHRLVPILNRRRYFSWTKSPARTNEQICLQYTMWTLVASQSSHLQHLREPLYQHACSLLDNLTAQDTIGLQIEYTQACILIVYYDLMKENFRRGWISAGRCIRVVQLMRLFEVDRPQDGNNRQDWVEKEEKRRAFWITYSLDIFISLRGEWPLSLSGYTASVRLPALEKDFDNNRYVEMPYLNMVLSSATPCVLSPFAESIVFLTLIRRISTSMRNKETEFDPKDAPSTFGVDMESLSSIVRSRLKTLAFKYHDESLPFSDDPMKIFAVMIAQSSVLHLYKTQRSLEKTSDNHQNFSPTLQYEAEIAAQEISSLSASIFHLGPFKIHPFTPIVLDSCIEFYKTSQCLDELTNPVIQQMCDLLNDLSKVNNIAREYLKN